MRTSREPPSTAAAATPGDQGQGSARVALLAHCVSLSRVGLAVAIFLLLTTAGTGRSIIALGLFGLGVLTDWLDGALARRARAVGSAGKWIDAGVDSVFFAGILLALFTRGVLAGVILVVFAARELLMYSTIRPLLVQYGLDPGARFAGKLKTVLQFAGVSLALSLLVAQESGLVAAAAVRRAVDAALAVAVIVSTFSLLSYWLPLVRDWPAPLQRCMRQAGIAVASFLAIQSAIWLLARGSSASDELFALAVVPWHAIVAGALAWRREDFRVLGGAADGTWLANLALPNVMTLFRFSSIPTLTLLLASGTRTGLQWIGPVFVGIIFATDLLDGRLARRLGITSHLGRILDSASDYAALLALSALLTWAGFVPLWLWLLLSSRLLLNAIASIVIVSRRGRHAASSTPWGKVSVGAMMLLLSLELLSWATGDAVKEPPPWVAVGLACAEIATGAIVAISILDKVRYVGRVLRRKDA